MSAIIPPSCPRSPLSFLREPTSTPWTTGLEHAREHERGDHCTEGVVGAARPQGAPGQSRRAQRAQRALPEPGSVPCPSSHTSASSAAPPAIEAGRDASAGRGGGMRGGRARPTRARKARPQGHARAEPAAHVPWAAPQPMAVVRALLDRRATGTTPTWCQGSTFIIATGPPGRTRALGRHDGPQATESCARKRVVGIFLGG